MDKEGCYINLKVANVIVSGNNALQTSSQKLSKTLHVFLMSVIQFIL